MARVTVEDCLKTVKNRFELVALASLRAKALSSGSPTTIERNNDKNAVIALREIAARNVDIESLKEILKNSFENKNKFDSIDENLTNTISKEDEIEIEADLENYEIENIDTIEDHMDEGFSFEEDNFDVKD